MAVLKRCGLWDPGKEPLTGWPPAGAADNPSTKPAEDLGGAAAGHSEADGEPTNLEKSGSEVSLEGAKDLVSPREDKEPPSD